MTAHGQGPGGAGAGGDAAKIPRPITPGPEMQTLGADNYGHAAVYRGQIDGDRLIFESMQDAGIRLRFTWDASNPDVITWRNEMTTGDGAWFLIEEYPMVPQ